MGEPFRFSTQVKVRFNETDQQGHVNFVHYLSYFDVALTEYLLAIECSYTDLLAEGQDMVYTESHCNYRSPVTWPEILRVHARIAAAGERSLRFEFQVYAEADGREVADGHIVAVTMDSQTHRPRAVSGRLRQAVAQFEGIPA